MKTRTRRVGGGLSAELAGLANPAPVSTELPDDDFDPTGGAVAREADRDDATSSDDSDADANAFGDDDEGVFEPTKADRATVGKGKLRMRAGIAIDDGEYVGKSSSRRAMEGAWAGDEDDDGCTSQLECVCPEGTALNAAGDACDACVPGFFKATSGMHACASCPSGKYSSFGATECSDCAAGTYTLDVASSTCVACEEGTFSPAGSVDGCHRCGLQDGQDRSSPEGGDCTEDHCEPPQRQRSSSGFAGLRNLRVKHVVGFVTDYLALRRLPVRRAHLAVIIVRTKEVGEEFEASAQMAGTSRAARSHEE